MHSPSHYNLQVGRRVLLLTASTVGTIADIAVAILFAETYNGTSALPYGASIASVVLVRVLGCSAMRLPCSS